MVHLTKFMQMVDPLVYVELEAIARERGISVQELIRAIIIPEWFKQSRTKAVLGANKDSETTLSSTLGLE